MPVDSRLVGHKVPIDREGGLDRAIMDDLSHHVFLAFNAIDAISEVLVLAVAPGVLWDAALLTSGGMSLPGALRVLFGARVDLVRRAEVLVPVAPS